MTGGATDRKFANTLARGLSILSAFQAGDDGLSHADIASRTGLPKPTVSRLTYTLCQLGFLKHGRRNERFRLGPAAIMLGSIASISVPFLDLVSADMQSLADRTSTLTLIAVREGDRMLVLRTWRPAQASTVWLEPGHRIPVYGSSEGMAVTASMSDEQFDMMRPEETLRRYRQDGYDQLLKQGFALPPAPLRHSDTMTSVSVPYFAGEFGESVGFACCGLPNALSDARLTKEVGPALRDVVHALENRVGQMPAMARRGGVASG